MHITVYWYNCKYKINSGLSEKAVAIASLKQLVFKMKSMGLFVTLLLAAVLLSSTSDAAPTIIEKITAKLAAKGLGAGLGLGFASKFPRRPSFVAVPVVAQPVPVLHVPVRTRVVFG